MKAYLLTSGMIFGLITAAHVWRVFIEPTLWRAPWFILITLCAAAFALWAFRLFRETARASRP